MASIVRTGRSDRPACDHAGAEASHRATQQADGPAAFVLYVEGPRDHDLLRTWAGRLSRKLALSLEPCAFILGGRRPARAIEDFKHRGGADAGVRGLVVLDRDDRDDHDDNERALAAEPGLELFTWRRRHIESYVLVPSAIRRVLESRVDAPQLERLMEDVIPDPDDESACRRVNAKRLLGNKGPLAQSIGHRLSPGQIARAMRADEFHPDVLDLFSRVRTGLGLVEPTFEVVRRASIE
jgi:hypothetical protein